MRTTLIKKGKIRVIIVILVIICSIISFLKIKSDSKRWVDADVTVKLPFEIDILSTGKSDFILIESEGKFVVIDCGFYENATKIEKFLNYKGVEDIETKHKTEIESLNAKIAEYESKLKDIELTKTIKDYFKDSKFISKRVEDSVIEEIKKKNFELKDGKLEGIDAYIEELKKENNVFETENQNTKQVFMHTGKQKQENVQGNTSPFLNALYKGLDTNKSDK